MRIVYIYDREGNLYEEGKDASIFCPLTKENCSEKCAWFYSTEVEFDEYKTEIVCQHHGKVIGKVKK